MYVHILCNIYFYILLIYVPGQGCKACPYADMDEARKPHQAVTREDLEFRVAQQQQPQMQQPMQMQQQQPAPASLAGKPQTPPPPPAKYRKPAAPPEPPQEWHYIDREGEQKGPASSRQLKEQYKADAVDDECIVWCADLTEWTKISEVTDLVQYLKF